MTPRRVLIVAPHFPPHRLGGTEDKALALARALNARGIDTGVLCIEDVRQGARTSVTREDGEHEGVRVRRVHLVLGPTDDLRLWFDQPLLTEEVARTIDAWRPDLVQLLSGYLWGTAPIEAARGAGIPVVATLTDYWFLCPTIQLLRGDGSLCGGPEPIECARCLYDEKRTIRAIDVRAPGLMRRWWSCLATVPRLGALVGLPARLEQLARRQARLGAALNACDSITASSRLGAERHVANGVDGSRITLVANAIPKPRGPVPSTSAPDEGEVHFAYIGQVAPVKGVDVLVRAFRRLRRSGRPIRLSVHGKINASRQYARRLERLAQSDPAISFSGPYEPGQVLALLARAHWVVIPSLWDENAPGTIHEAYLAGRPVIASRVGGITEIVRDDVDGLLFERGDVADLARVLQRAVDEPGLFERLRAAVRPLPDLETRFVPDLIDVYARTLARRSAGA
ncbi:MAG: glycosyltransferase family 4 protein [Vicinamibacterales bacterium]